MIILMWVGAAVILSAGHFIGANVKRASYESRVEELEAQRDAARAMLDHARYEIVQLQEELDELSPLTMPPDAAQFSAGILSHPKVVEANRRATVDTLRLVEGYRGAPQ